MADEVIKYSDIIQPDGAFDDLLLKMAETIKLNKEMTSIMSSNADRMERAIKSVSGATQQGRASIDETTRAAARMQAAYVSLNTITADTSKLMSEVRTRLAGVDAASVNEVKSIENIAKGYDKLRTKIAQALDRYNALTDSRKNGNPFTEKQLETVHELERAMSALGTELEAEVNSILKVQAAQDKLNFVMSGAGAAVSNLRAQTQELEKQRKRDVKATQEQARAQEILRKAAQGTADLELKKSIDEERELKVAELTVRINSMKADTYGRLSLEYERNKILLGNLTVEEQRNTEAGAKLVVETRKIYEEMQRFQEATGKHALSVGDYGKGFEMLRFQTAQVIREIPSAAISLNTFFLAISNNVPMLLDQMRSVRNEIDAAKKAGEKYVSLGKQMAKAILNWQTALVLVLFALSKYGKQMAEWIGQMIRGRDAVMKLSKALKNVAKNISEVDGNNSKNIITVMRLSEQWKKLNTEAEKTKWLKDHQSDFRELGLAIDSVNKAESLFMQNTSMVLTAYAKRAAAASAEALAQEKIKEAIQKQAQATSIAKIKGFDTDNYGDAVRQAIARDNAAAKGLGINVKDTKEISDEVVSLVDKLATLQNEYEDLRKNQTSYAEGLLRAEGKGSGAEKAEEDAKKLNALAKQIADTEELIKRATGAQVVTFDSVRDIQRRFREVRNLQTTATRLLREGMQYFEIMRSFEEEYEKLLEEYGFGGGSRKGQRNITEPEKAMVRNVSTKSADAQRELITSNFEKSKQSLEDTTAKNIRELQDTIRKNNKWLQGLASGEYTVDDAEKMMGMTVEEIKDMNERAAAAIVAIEEKKQQDLKDLEVQFAIDIQKLRNDDIQNRLEAVKNGSKEEYDLQQQLINGQEAIELYELQLNHDENFEKDRLAIVEKYAKKRADRDYSWQLQELEMFKTIREEKLAAVSDSEQDLKEAYEVEIIELERRIEKLKNSQLAAELQVPESVIDAKYDRKQRKQQGGRMMRVFRDKQTVDRAEYSSGLTSGRDGGPGLKPNEYKMKRFNLNQQIAEIERILELKDLLELTDAQIAEYNAKLEELSDEKKKSGPMSSFADHGLFGGVLEQMGLDHEQIDAMNAAKDIVIDAINEIADAEVEAAQRAVEAQQERVDAAQNAYDAEVQARANGYANNVATAKKEMEAEKKRLAQKQKLLEQAERRKEALDSLSQVSSLITATAQIWQAFSGMMPWGAVLAGAATAAMFGAFIAAKVKAKQVASAEYGEGGLEFLEGGSHASGNDIDLGTKNRRGRRMRAEGGEAMAIINHRQTRHYRKVLPGIIDSLNKGVFEEKYLKVFDGAQGIALQQNNTAQIDLSNLERDVQDIRRMSGERSYMMPDGTLVVQRGNVKRYIRR